MRSTSKQQKSENVGRQKSEASRRRRTVRKLDAVNANRALDEVNPLALVSRRQAAAAASADDSRTLYTRAIRRTGSKQCPAFECRDRLAAQHTRQLDPLRAPNSRTSL